MVDARFFLEGNVACTYIHSVHERTFNMRLSYLLTSIYPLHKYMKVCTLQMWGGLTLFLQAINLLLYVYDMIWRKNYRLW